MLPPQQEITEMGLLSGPFSCVLDMPTGSGKTWLSQQAIQTTVEAGGRAIYLTPLRALAAEIADRWARLMPGISVGVFTGDYGGNGRAFPMSFEKARILVMTPERLDACTRAWRSHWTWLPDVELIVVDEIHLLADYGRGPRLESAISRFRRLNPFARLVGLSATLGNAPEIADWLEGVSYHSDWRPVPLEWRIVHFRKPSDKCELLHREVERNIQNGGKSLVFVQSRRRAEEMSRFLGKSGMRALHHHAGLKRGERHETEDLFRAGTVDVLVATGTLEMGLNLPVRQVVLYDLQHFDGHEFVPLSTNTVWQRVGRAGRPGLDECGEAVLLAPTWDRSAYRYREGRFEAIRSRLNGQAAFAEQIVAEVASGASTTRPQLQRAFCQSLAARQGVLGDLNGTLNDMCEAGLLNEWNDPDRSRVSLVLRATKAGRILVRHMLRPKTILSIQRAIDKFSDLTYFDMLTVIACTEDCEPLLAVDFEELDGLAAALAQEPSFLMRRSGAELAGTLTVSSRRLLSALKMALVLRNWTRLGDADAVAESFDCYPFEVTRLHESMARLLQATNELLTVASENRTQDSASDELLLVDRVAALRRMVTFGIDEEAVTLCFVRGIGGTFARRLFEHSITDIEELAAAEPDELANIKGLSSRRALQWIEDATNLVKTRGGFSLRDLGPTTLVRNSEWLDGVDPYRLRRSIDLSVEKVSPEVYRVSGGLEPHEVSLKEKSWVCDCVDHQRGNLCKHILAVQRIRRDKTVSRLIKVLTTAPHADELDLIELWLSRENSVRRTNQT